MLEPKVFEPVTGKSTRDVVPFFPSLPQGSKIFLAVAPCRSGTTASLKISAAAGIPAVYQPLKENLRWQMHGEERPIILPSAPVICIKETIGPYTKTESTFNPLDVLLEAGFPKEQINVVFMMREPRATLTSWLKNFGRICDHESLVENMIYSYQTMEQIHDLALRENIHHTSFLYESLGNIPAEKSFAAIFKFLGLPFKEGFANNWPAYEENIKRYLHLGEEPPLYSHNDLSELHASAREATGYYYHKTPEALVWQVLKPEYQAKITEGGVLAVYDRFAKRAEADLEIAIAGEQERSQPPLEKPAGRRL